MARVILVRHGETELNVEHRFRGRADPTLSAAGRDQIRRLARALAGARPARLLSSPRTRACATAAAIEESCGVTSVIDPAIDDVDYGAWTGLTRAEVVARWPDEHAAFLVRPEEVTFPGGESMLRLLARAWEATIASRDAPGVTILVTHDVVIRTLVCRALDAPLGAMHRVRVDLTSTTGLRMTSEGARLEWVNEACHLQAAYERP